MRPTNNRESFPSRPTLKRPVDSWRKLGYHGKIRAYVQNIDPGFDIDGLPDPFIVYFPVLVHNGHTATIYVGAVLVSPPAGWTDSEDQLGSVAIGANLYAEKDNATRDTPTAGTNETVTLRTNYYSDAAYSALIGYDEWEFTIYWESVAAGTVDDTDDFETNLEGWTKTDEVGTTILGRSSVRSYSKTYSMYHYGIGDLEIGYVSKTVKIGAGSRAYIFGYLQAEYTGSSGISLEIITPVETIFVPLCSPNRWSRFGARLNPGASNEVRLRAKGRHLTADSIWYDLIRWIRY